MVSFPASSSNPDDASTSSATSAPPYVMGLHQRADQIFAGLAPPPLNLLAEISAQIRDELRIVSLGGAEPGAIRVTLDNSVSTTL